MNDLGALLAGFSGDEPDDVEASNGTTALFSPESVSAARAESAEGTGSGSGEIGTQAVKAGIVPSGGSNDVDQSEVHFSEGDGASEAPQEEELDSDASTLQGVRPHAFVALRLNKLPFVAPWPRLSPLSRLQAL